MERSSLQGLRPLVVASVAILTVLTSLRPACGYRPSSPEVQKAVARAVKFLAAGASGNNYGDTRPGARALVGLALLKSGAPSNHPAIISSARFLQNAISRAGDRAFSGFDIYSTALSIVFLVNLDANRYSREVNFLLRELESKQKPHGGWGYEMRKTGDTSMTQNAVLAYWEANKAEVPISFEVVDRALIWLLKTQDPSGGFGYQGTVSGNFQPVRQSMIKPSMSGAGLGSVYVCADLLRIGKPPERHDDLPPALREIKKKQAPASSRVDPRLVHQALARGKGWMAQHFVVEQRDYHLYNLYTVERYHTFRELSEGKTEAEPRWYNDGVRYLLSKQKDDGSWMGTSGNVPATAFGVLFLVRSTRISVEGKRSFGDGTLIGGRGLPKHAAVVTVVEGNVRAKPELGYLDQLLRGLDETSGPDRAEALAALEQLPSEEAESFVAKHSKKLQELAGDRSPEARLAAVRALGKRRDLDHVPTLLYALTDPDPEIVREARDALRRISRRFQGFGMPDKPTELQRHAALRKWQAWYLAIRPDAELEN